MKLIHLEKTGSDKHRFLLAGQAGRPPEIGGILCGTLLLQQYIRNIFKPCFKIKTFVLLGFESGDRKESLQPLQSLPHATLSVF